MASGALYAGLGLACANVIIGVLSAIVDDNLPMIAVLTMEPAMSDGLWFLVTLTCSIGGPILWVGLAAGWGRRGGLQFRQSFALELGGWSELCRGDCLSSVVECTAVARIWIFGPK